VPEVIARGTRLFVEDRGRGDETIVFAHGLLCSTRMYGAQLAALEQEYRVVAWDHRGQGRSGSPRERSHHLDDVMADALGVLDALGLDKVHYVGLSMGGFVGMRLAARHPERVASLVLLATAAHTEPVAQQRRFRVMNAASRLFGVRVVAPQVVPVMFGKSFLSDPARAADAQRCWDMLIEQPPHVHRAVRGVIERESVVHELPRIQAPTLVVHGVEDKAISIRKAEETAKAIPNATFVRWEDAGHMLTLEVPERTTEVIREFVRAHPIRR
jgi:pimeloyl-ACP methyl ester carboxylesterase